MTSLPTTAITATATATVTATATATATAIVPLYDTWAVAVYAYHYNSPMDWHFCPVFHVLVYRAEGPVDVKLRRGALAMGISIPDQICA